MPGRERSYSPRGALVLAALDVLPDSSIMVFDLDLVFVVVRGEALKDVGMDPHDLEERPAAEALTPSRWAFYEPFYRAALAGEASSIEVGSSDGDERRYVVNIGPVRDRTGTVIGGVAVATDISDHLRLREALEESEEQFRLTMEQAAVGMALMAGTGDFLVVNPALSRLLGYEHDELLERSYLAVIHPEDAADNHDMLVGLTNGERRAVTRRSRFLRRDGAVVWADLTITAVRDRNGAFRHHVAQLTDVTGEVLAREAAEESQRLYRLLAENASDVVYLADPSGTIVWASPSFSSVLGIEPADAVGMRTEDLVHPDDLALVRTRRSEIYAGQQPHDAIVRFRSGAGAYLDMSVTVHLITEGGSAAGAVVGLRDVSVEQRALRELARSEERFRLAMTAAPVGMAISDPDGRFVQVNTAFCELVGLPESAVLGATVTTFLGPGDHELVDTVTAALADPGVSTFRHQHRLVSGSRELWVEHSASVLRDEEDRPVFYVHQFADHTEAHELRQDLEFRATHDALTGVANRGELMRQLRHSLRRGRGGAAWLGVLFCDIDNLKPLNDEYGHRTGDAAIKAVAERLTGVVRVIDLVARIGGDEFVVLLEGLRSREELGAIAEKCRKSVEGPVEVDGHVAHVSVSVGAVLAGQDESPDEVLARADHALHRAKAGGRHQVDLD